MWGAKEDGAWEGKWSPPPRIFSSVFYSKNTVTEHYNLIPAMGGDIRGCGGNRRLDR